MVEVTNVVKHRAWRHPVALSIEKGEHVAIVGRNGSGKSTLLQTMIGVLRPDAGRVRLLGRDPYRRPEVRRRVAVAFQDISLDSSYPVRRTLGLHAALFRVPRKRLDELVDRFEVPLDATPFHLSGGQQKRAELVKALMQDADVYFFDEPTAGLDRSGIELLESALKRLRDRGATVVIVTHDRELLTGVDRVVDFDELKERSALMAGDVQKLELELSTWKPELDAKIKAIRSVIGYEVEPNPEVLQRLGIPPELFKGVVFVEDDVADAGSPEAGASRGVPISTDALFERCRLRLETSDNKGVLPELLKLLVEHDVQVLGVSEGA